MADTNVSFTIKSDYVTRVLEAFDKSYSGRVGEDGKAIMTKGEWAKKKVIDYVKEVIKGYEANTAAETARATAEAGADSIGIE